MNKQFTYDVIIIGAGAAGLMCAAVAGARGRSVLLIERANKPGKKILMSGGGRCNFTNLDIQTDNFISDNPHYCKSALQQYTQFDFIELVNQYSIKWHEKTQGQLFCNDSSKDILNMLLAECERSGIKPMTSCNIESVWFDDVFQVKTEMAHYKSESLVVACGGLSVPTLGGSDYGYRLAKQFGMSVVDFSAGLVPFTLSGDLKILASELAGVSLTVTASTASAYSKKAAPMSFTDELLFTHRGLSGPAILQLSNYWMTGTEVVIDLLPDIQLEELLIAQKKQGSRHLKSFLATLLPPALVKQFEKRWWPEHNGRPIAEWPDKELQDIASRIKRWTFKPSGTEGYRTAEVTRGGVATRNLDSKTMVSKIMPGLYIIGEAVDVTGHLGGYNFQWAWSSGWVAAQHV